MRSDFIRPNQIWLKIFRGKFWENLRVNILHFCLHKLVVESSLGTPLTFSPLGCILAVVVLEKARTVKNTVVWRRSSLQIGFSLICVQRFVFKFIGTHRFPPNRAGDGGVVLIRTKIKISRFFLLIWQRYKTNVTRYKIYLFETRKKLPHKTARLVKFYFRRRW